jgi:hypothetical protein
MSFLNELFPLLKIAHKDKFLPQDFPEEFLNNQPVCVKNYNSACIRIFYYFRFELE